MRILDLEFGLALGNNGKVYWSLSYDRGTCGCYLFTVGPFYITWLMNECKADWRDDEKE